MHHPVIVHRAHSVRSPLSFLYLVLSTPIHHPPTAMVLLGKTSPHSFTPVHPALVSRDASPRSFVSIPLVSHTTLVVSLTFLVM
jgi:hypothetical protein